MATKERITKMLELKKAFKGQLITSIVNILKLIQNKAEIEESYINTAKKSCEGLKGIADLERNTQAQIMFKNGLALINSRNIEEKVKKLSEFLDFVTSY